MSQLRSSLRSNRKELVDSLYLIALQGVNKLLPLVVLPYLLAVLGAEGYAYVGFSLAVVQFAVLIVDFGFDLSATKHVALVRNDRAELTKVFWSVVGAKTLLLAVAVPLILLPIYLVPSYRPYTSAVLCTLPMAVGSAFTFMWMFQGIGKVRHLAVINTFSKVLLLPLIFFFVKSESDSNLAAFLQASVYMLTAFVSCLWLWRLKMVDAPRFSWKSMRMETAESLPLFLSRAATSVYTQLFVVILALFCAQDAVGRYTSAEALMRAACFVLYVPLTQAFFPRISTLSVVNREQGVRTMHQLLRIIVVAMLVISILIAILAPFLPVMLGGKYAGLNTLLYIMAAAPVFISVGAVYGQMGLIALGNSRTKRWFRNVYLIVSPLALIMLLPLAAQWQEYGAAMALLFTEIMVAVLMFAAYSRSRSLTFSNVQP